jgi:hypothetical protein
MRHAIAMTVLAGLCAGASARAQTLEDVTKGQPPYVSVLTTWGMRPEWGRTGEYVYFLHRLVGDVFKVNVRTREIAPVTVSVHHAGIQRCLVLANGDLLLGIGNINTGDIQRDKGRLDLFVLKQDEPTRLYPLGEAAEEGPAVSRKSMKIAWTTPGQLEIRTGEIAYDGGVPSLIDRKTIVSYRDAIDNRRLETQDFRPPDDNELIFTHYYGNAGDHFFNAEVSSYNFTTGAIRDYSKSPDSYDEAEGMFPDGQWTMIESDRHLPKALRNKYKVDIFRLRLDGSGETEQLADLAQRFPDTLRSDNPVVDPSGRFVVYQFGFSRDAGARGQGLLLLDLQKYEEWKRTKGK